MTTFVLNNVTFKTNDKNYFGKVVEGKTHSISREEYAEAKAQFDALTPAQAPEAPKSEDKKKSPAKPVVPTLKSKDYTITEDTRGRISYKQDNTILAMVQPAKTHFTVYISKQVLTTPAQAIDALKKFGAEAVVNPTFKRNKGRDPFSVKATVTEATRNDLPEIVDLLITKNNEIVKA